MQIISYPQYLHTGIADTFLKVSPYFKIASSPAEAIHRFGE